MATWVGLGSDKHRIEHHGQVWRLVATPGAKYPWLMYTEVQQNGRPAHGTEQEIGAPKLEDAKHSAELWLDLAKYCA